MGVSMSDSITVTFSESSGDKPPRKITVNRDTTILMAAQQAGIEIHATCGSRGRCRSCRVKILKGDIPPPTVQDEVQLGHEEVLEGFRLSCQTRMLTDSVVRPMPPKNEEGHQILFDSDLNNPKRHLDSGIAKHVVHADTPVEEHHQTSDLEEILSVVEGLDSYAVPTQTMRKVPRMLREQSGQLTVTTFNSQIIDIESGDTSQHMYGMAFDIGTTSVVATLLDLETGEQLASAGGMNSQAMYGGDLMSRIAYVQFDEKKLAKLRAIIVNQVNRYIRECCADAKVDPNHIYKIMVVGNTCMHHIFLGIDVTYLGLAPYAPVVRESLTLPASDLPLKSAPNAQVCLLPIVAGFVGADTVGCILSSRIYDSDEIQALVDIGTNGEVVLGSRERLTVCSAPAGPALEGAQIRDGMRGAIGAIEKIEVNHDVHCSIIGNVPAIGICGSGLIDAAAQLVDSKVIDSNGNMRKRQLDELPETLRTRLSKTEKGSTEFILVEAEDTGKNQKIGLTQADIRQLQLAKSAIYSGIRMLQSVMRILDEEIQRLMLCGGFGNYINIESAKTIRLIPDLQHEKINYIGNAALLGAQIALLSESERRKADDIVNEIEHVALAARPDFQDIFVDSLAFMGSAFPAAQKPAHRRSRRRSKVSIE